VLRDCIVTNFNAEAEGMGPDDVIKRVLKLVPVDAAANEGAIPNVFKASEVN